MLPRQQAKDLLALLHATRAEELTCEECVALLSEYVDHADAQPVPDAGRADLQAVREHLELCPFCSEECEALRKSLE